TPIEQCWVCGGIELSPANEERLALDFLLTFPELERVMRDYHGQRFVLNRCGGCGFMQPTALPSHPGYFDALYGAVWTDEWLEEEFTLGYKDTIFRTILGSLGRRLPTGNRSLLDVGTHVGRMLVLAREAGWRPEAIELNPKSASFAAVRTGLPVHRKNA